MNRPLHCFALLMCQLIVTSLLGDERPMTVEDSLGIKALGSFQWSPDEEHVIYTVREWNKDDNKYVTHIYRLSREGGEADQLTRGKKSESNPRISPDGNYLAFQASREEANQIWLLPLTGGEAFELTKTKHGVSDYGWSHDSKRIAYTTRDEHPDAEQREKKKKDGFDPVVVDRDLSWNHLWVIELETKETNRLTEGEFNAYGPRWSPDDASIVFQATYAGAQQSSWRHSDDNQEIDIMLVSLDGGPVKNLTPQPGLAFSPRWSADGRKLSYGFAPGRHEKSNLMALDVHSRLARNLTAANPDSVTGGEWSPDGDSLYYSQANGVYSQLYQIPTRGGGPKQLTDGTGISGGFELSPTGRFMAYTHNRPDRPADVWVRTVESGEAVQITHTNPQIEGVAIAETRPIRWKTPDDREIEGIVTLPLNYQEGEQYPLILQIHGGPHSRFTHTFGARNQVLAAKGYAILQPNPRGSTGYGHDFMVANRGDWGGNDFHVDDMSGVDHLVEQGIADPDRLVVMGGSYGGFSTFWAVTQTDRFKAAIAHAAISDWYSYYGQTDIPAYLEFGFFGFPWETTETYRKFSPITFAERVKTPLLITHGEGDRRVPISQAEQFYTALKKLGAEVEFVRYPREGHQISEPNHVIDLLERQLAWFDRHLKIERDEEKKEVQSEAKEDGNPVR